MEEGSNTILTVNSGLSFYDIETERLASSDVDGFTIDASLA